MAFKLILISPERDLKNEIQILLSLMKSGLRFYHLRKPFASKKDLENYLIQIPASYRKRVVLHQHFTLAQKFNLKGIHLNEIAKKKYAVLSNKYKIISASFHSIEEINANKNSFTYLFLSPVFNSKSKKNYAGKVELLKSNCKSKRTVIALGGIDHLNISGIKNNGFGGAAFIGSVWLSKHPVNTFIKMKEKVKE